MHALCGGERFAFDEDSACFQYRIVQTRFRGSGKARIHEGFFVFSRGNDFAKSIPGDRRWSNQTCSAGGVACMLGEFRERVLIRA